MELVMPHEHDPLKRRPRPKNKTQDTEDETEARLNGELNYLMRDPRYQGGDKDYRFYVQRQFRRVYDDPSGKPQPLRIGRPKTFATSLEPFDPARERRLRLGGEEDAGSPPGAQQAARPSESADLGSMGVSGSSPQSRLRRSPPAEANRRGGEVGSIVGSDITPPEDRALMQLDGSSRPNRPLPSEPASEYAINVPVERVNKLRDEETRGRLLDVLRSTKTFLDDLEIAGRHTSASLLRHYLLGTGTEVTLPAEFLSEWPLAQNAVDDVDAYFSDWMMGRLEDSRFGFPTLEIGDGERIVVGGDESGPADDLNDRVKWEATFAGVGDAFFGRGNPNHRFQDFWSAVRKLEFAGEEMTSFGGATAQGFGYLVFEREGDIITVRGFVDYRMHDIYKFDWADSVNPGFRLLQKHHIGESFEINTGLARSYLNAVIQLKDGLPASIAVDRSPPTEL